MKKTLSFIIQGITGEKPKIKEIKEGERVIFLVQIAKEKIGLVIGKGGKTIKAINTLLAIKKSHLTSPPSFSLRLEEK